MLHVRNASGQLDQASLTNCHGFAKVGPQRGALSIMQRQNLIDLEPVCFRERIPMH